MQVKAPGNAQDASWLHETQQPAAKQFDCAVPLETCVVHATQAQTAILCRGMAVYKSKYHLNCICLWQSTPCLRQTIRH